MEDTLRTYFCPNGTYNDMATLFFNSQEIAIKQLFHLPGGCNTLLLFGHVKCVITI